jgi:hypothetical protein
MYPHLFDMTQDLDPVFLKAVVSLDLTVGLSCSTGLTGL